MKSGDTAGNWDDFIRQAADDEYRQSDLRLAAVLSARHDWPHTQPDPEQVGKQDRDRADVVSSFVTDIDRMVTDITDLLDRCSADASSSLHALEFGTAVIEFRMAAARVRRIDHDNQRDARL